MCIFNHPLRAYADTRTGIQKLEELHRKYGPIVRTGPNEVSISNWRHLRTIYLNTKGMIKNPDFYEAATFVGKDNIFQML